MNYRPLILLDDDEELIRNIFRLKASKANIELIDFATWRETRTGRNAGSIKSITN